MPPSRSSGRFSGPVLRSRRTAPCRNGVHRFEMSETLEDILNDCLERLAQGENVAECVGRYPDHGDELMPLLEVAASAIDTASSVSYRPEAKARGLQRLTAALAQREEPARARLLPGLTWRPRVSRPVAAGLIAALLTTGMAFGATTASSGSVPGEPLYLVKTAKEKGIIYLTSQGTMMKDHQGRSSASESIPSGTSGVLSTACGSSVNVHIPRPQFLKRGSVLR